MGMLIMNKLAIFIFAIMILFSKFCWSNELNYKIISNYLIEKGYKDTSDDCIFGRQPNVLDLNKENSNIILKFSEEGILYEVSIMLTNAKNSSSEIINDGKWIFSKLINARAQASRWFNDCISGINYNKDVKTPDYTYFCYPAADVLNFAFTTQY